MRSREMRRTKVDETGKPDKMNIISIVFLWSWKLMCLFCSCSNAKKGFLLSVLQFRGIFALIDSETDLNYTYEMGIAPRFCYGLLHSETSYEMLHQPGNERKAQRFSKRANNSTIEIKQQKFPFLGSFQVKK